MRTIANPFYASRIKRVAPLSEARDRPVYARLPLAPRNASPVPHLTSLYHFHRAGEYGDRSYPGNCGGNLIKDLLRYCKPQSVFDPMTGSGTCRDVCDELGIYCWSSDLREGADACDASQFPRGCFEFCWIHPPYWRQKLYSEDARCLSRTPTLDAFLDRYQQLLANCVGSLVSGGKVGILIGDYSDREAGFVSLTYHTLCGYPHNIPWACGRIASAPPPTYPAIFPIAVPEMVSIRHPCRLANMTKLSRW